MQSSHHHRIRFVLASLVVGIIGRPAVAELFYSVNTQVIGDHSIFRSAIDGSNQVEIVSELPNPSAEVAVDRVEQKLYWSVPLFDLGIFRSNLDGSEIQHIVSTGINSSSGLTVDTWNRKLYWRGGNEIKRADLDGSHVETIYTSTTSQRPVALAVDGETGALYWTSTAGNAIWTSDLDGSNAQHLISGLHLPRSIAIDTLHRKLYWTETGTGFESISRSDLDGTSVEPLLSGLFAPQALAVDPFEGFLFYGVGKSGPGFSDIIYRANLDGSDSEAIVSSLSSVPTGLAVLTVPEPSTVLLCVASVVIGLIAVAIRSLGQGRRRCVWLAKFSRKKFPTG